MSIGDGIRILVEQLLFFIFFFRYHQYLTTQRWWPLIVTLTLELRTKIFECAFATDESTLSHSELPDEVRGYYGIRQLYEEAFKVFWRSNPGIQSRGRLSCTRTLSCQQWERSSASLSTSSTSSMPYHSWTGAHVFKLDQVCPPEDWISFTQYRISLRDRTFFQFFLSYTENVERKFNFLPL